MFGILLVQKPTGKTSHDIVNDVRRKLKTKRVGHAGTLDPLATGLLVIAVGPATRFLQYLPLEPKEYIATLRFGISTDSYDADGMVTGTFDVPADLAYEVATHKAQFSGLIKQIPPMFSAVKMGGKPLYHYARQGVELVRENRTVHIGAFDTLSIKGEVGQFRIECSGGTYVRTLADDLGKSIGCGAHLIALERTKVGRFTLEQGCLPEDISYSHLISLKEALKPMGMLPCDSAETEAIRFGKDLPRNEIARKIMGESNLVALLEPKGSVFSIARVSGEMLHPECVIPLESMLDGI